MKIITSMSLLLILVACNDGGKYLTFNPPTNGVTIQGESAGNVSGSYLADVSHLPLGCPNEKCGSHASNRSFLTIGSFVPNVSHYGIELSNNSFDIILPYYKDSNGDLARNNIDYENGMIILQGYNPVLFIKDINFDDITQRGVIPLRDSLFTFYINLSSPATSYMTIRTGELKDGTIVNNDVMGEYQFTTTEQ